MSTIRLSEAVPLLPALEVRSPDVFMNVASIALVAVTLTITVQPLVAPTLPFVKVIVEPPSAATIFPMTQLVMAFAGVARVTPASKVSVNARSVTGVPLSLVMVTGQRTDAARSDRVWGKDLAKRRLGVSRCCETQSEDDLNENSPGFLSEFSKVSRPICSHEKPPVFPTYPFHIRRGHERSREDFARVIPHSSCLFPAPLLHKRPDVPPAYTDLV